MLVSSHMTGLHRHDRAVLLLLLLEALRRLRTFESLMQETMIAVTTVMAMVKRGRSLKWKSLRRLDVTMRPEFILS
jgi:hypothetical protein